jgi:hypothetical protein
MKNVLSVLVMLMLISSAAFANVGKPGSAGIAIVRKGSTFNVFYKNDKVSDVRVSIRDAKHDVVFTEVLKKVDGFLRPYNFSALSEGNYTIEVSDESGSQVETVSYRNGKVERLMSLVRIAGENEKFLLSVPNKGDDVLNVKIFDAKSNLLYEANEEIHSDFAKVYNFAKLKQNVVLEITDKHGAKRILSL